MADDKLDTDKIVAALFTVEICAQKEPVEPRAFMPVYLEFLELLKNEQPKPAPKKPTPKKPTPNTTSGSE
jgi:hypothetical protein